MSTRSSKSGENQFGEKTNDGKRGAVFKIIVLSEWKALMGQQRSTRTT